MPITKKTTVGTKPKATKVPKAEPRAKKTSSPLIIEPHPADYMGFPFITLVQYRNQSILAIIDNVNDDTMHVFALDMCGPSNVSEEAVIATAAEWYQTNRHNFPVSIEFSLRGLTQQTSKIYRALNVEFISRVIGPMPKYPMATTKSIKRRRRKALPREIEIRAAD